MLAIPTFSGTIILLDGCLLIRYNALMHSRLLDIRQLYDYFDAPMVPLDCGTKCAVHNPSGKPFCCDICHAVPATYRQEWDYLQQNTDLWHAWRGDECPTDTTDPA